MNNVAFVLSLPHRAVAMATLVALLAWTLGLPAWINTAQAAAVEEFSDTISDSDLGVNATHTLFFTTTNAMSAGQQFRIYFDTIGSPDFDFTGMTDADLIATSTGFTAVTACGAGGDEIDLVASSTGDYIEGTVCAGDSVPAGLIGMQIGDTNEVNNPATAQSYVISLQGYGATPIADDGDTRIAIIDDVTVTAEVETIFIFSINAVGAGITVNGDTQATVGTSTATTVPFGVIPINDDRVMAQELRVDTNALNGFAVTVQADQTLTAGNAATIDVYDEGTPLATPTAFAGPTAVLGSTNTYGHWGLTTDDLTLGSGLDFNPGVDAGYVGNFVGNPVEVFHHTGPVVNTAGLGVGSTTVAYKIEITELQEAATDYTATLTYIATPVF